MSLPDMFSPELEKERAMQAIVRHLSDPEDLWLELWGVADGPETIPDADNDPEQLRAICLDEATFHALSALSADSEPVTVRIRLELVCFEKNEKHGSA